MTTTSHSENYAELLRLAEELVNMISRDENGELIGGQYVNGNGGLISRETNMKSDEVRRAIHKVERGQEEQTHRGNTTPSV